MLVGYRTSYCSFWTSSWTALRMKCAQQSRTCMPSWDLPSRTVKVVKFCFKTCSCQGCWKELGIVISKSGGYVQSAHQPWAQIALLDLQLINPVPKRQCCTYSNSRHDDSLHEIRCKLSQVGSELHMYTTAEHQALQALECHHKPTLERQELPCTWLAHHKLDTGNGCVFQPFSPYLTCPL